METKVVKSFFILVIEIIFAANVTKLPNLRQIEKCLFGGFNYKTIKFAKGFHF